jgi:cell division protein FtsI (penicillin-binding protein 3)
VTGRAARFRILTTAVVLICVLVGLSLRAMQLTVLDGVSLQRRATRQHQQEVQLPPERGAILDRNGEMLALTRESAAVYVRPGQLALDPGALTRVARLLDVPSNVMLMKAMSHEPFVYLNRRVSLDRWSAVEELQVSGIGSEPSRMRYYPYGALAGQVLGFTGIDGQGLEGVERQLDAVLRGEVDALDVERDARGRRIAVDGRWRPLPRVGAQIELTIDAALQHVAERELAKAVEEFEADAGVAVVMAPETGEILAMANVPLLNPNAPSETVVSARKNRIVTDFYEPGSTFKVFLAAAALEHGVVRPEDKIFCENGSYPVGKRVIHDSHPHGTLTFAEVVQQSSNIGCAKVAERLGIERYAEAIERFGFGQPTKVELPGESPGRVRPASRWGRIHLITTAFGQGIAVTPLQLTRAFAAIANGGVSLRPHVIRRISVENGEAQDVSVPHVEQRVMSEATARTLTKILVGVVENGTGKAARMDGFTVAGKTGTAQKVEAGGHYSKRGRMSSFVGYVPAERPRLVVLVTLDSPRKAVYGGVVAAPTFRRIAEYGLERLGVRPAPQPILPPAVRPAAAVSLVAVADAAPAVVGIPSFIGLSMRDALVQAQRLGWAVQVEGSGYVVAQDPPPATAQQVDHLTLKFGSPAT